MIKCGHSFARPPVPDHTADFFSVHVLLNKCRRHQVRTAFATSGIASVAEAALCGEQTFTSLYLFHRGGCFRSIFAGRFSGGRVLAFTTLCEGRSCDADDQGKYEPVSPASK